MARLAQHGRRLTPVTCWSGRGSGATRSTSSSVARSPAACGRPGRFSVELGLLNGVRWSSIPRLARLVQPPTTYRNRRSDPSQPRHQSVRTTHLGPCLCGYGAGAVRCPTRAGRGLSCARHPPKSASAPSEYRRHGRALRPLRSRIRRLPLEHQNCGVVAEFVVLMLEDGMDEQAQYFRGALPCCGRSDDVVGEALQSELFAFLIA